MNQIKKECLVINASGEDRVGLVEKLTQQVTAAGCNIEQSRMSVLGGQFALIMLITGGQEALSALEQQLPSVGESLGLSLIHKWTHKRESRESFIPYDVEVVALDNPGIVHKLAQFFASNGINIEELETETYPAPHTGSPMFAVHITVGVPAGDSIARLREGFMAYCDDLNLDASIEPARS